MTYATPVGCTCQHNKTADSATPKALIGKKQHCFGLSLLSYISLATPHSYLFTMRFSTVLIASSLVSLAGAFAPAPFLQKPATLTARTASTTARFLSENQNDDDTVKSLLNTASANKNSYDLSSTFGKTTAASLISWLATTGVASAAGPDWGIFEGRTGSILHPIMMGSLFGLSLYTAFLGFQWRRQRTLGDDISALKKQMPSLGSYKTIQEALNSGEMESEEASLKAALPIEKEINDLTAERKELASQGNRDQHYTQGAWIAFLGTAFAIEVRSVCSHDV